jgi:putative tryptophan/tyrosine transport system substrate-binding protein
MLIKRVLIYLSLLTVFMFLPDIKPALSEEKAVIVVVRSKSIKPYDDALSGFEAGLNKNGYKVSSSYNLEDSKGRQPQLIDEIKNLKPDLVATIGTEASLFAKDNLKGLPIIFFMVINPAESLLISSPVGSGSNLTGVSLDILPELQFKKLKEILPKLSRVGIIYNTKEKDWIQNIERVAKKLDLIIVAKPISSAADVPHVLDELIGSADCLWAQVDPLIYNAQSSQYILLTLLRNKIPLMAFSSQYVKAGALLALECDYSEIGRQAAQMAIKVLVNKAATSISVALPERMNLVVNNKIAELIGVEIPRKLLEEAKEVY